MPISVCVWYVGCEWVSFFVESWIAPLYQDVAPFFCELPVEVHSSLCVRSSSSMWPAGGVEVYWMVGLNKIYDQTKSIAGPIWLNWS